MEKIAVDIDEVLCGTSCGQIIRDADLCLNSLRQYYELEVVTARNPRRIEETLGWIALKFPNTFSGVHFNRNYNGERVTKADVCLDIGAKYLIDDLPEHCNTAAEVGVTPLLFGRKTSDTLHTDVIRKENWMSILQYFLSIRTIDTAG